MSLAVRSRWLVAQYGIPIAVVLALVGTLALAGGAAAYVDRPTDEVAETVDEQRVETTVGTSAVVTGESTLYEEGERLTDMPVYFYNGTPDLTVEVSTSVEGAESLSVDQRLVLWQGAERDGALFWESREVLAADGTTVGSGAEDDAETLEATLDVASLRESAAETRAAIGGVGTHRVELRIVVQYTGDVEDELEASTGLVLADRAYWLEQHPSVDRTHSDTRTRTVDRPPNVGRALGFGGLGFGLLLLAVGVAALQRREFDLHRIETEIVRTRYDEWISRGEIPTKAGKQYIAIDTLQDLVDIAIDSNKRVIYDVEYETYGVVDADIVYYYTEGDDAFGEWFEV